MAIKSSARDWQTRIRLWAAITMAAYVIVYTIYYGLGLISVELMEDFHDLLGKVWPIFWLVPFAILTHVSLGLWKLFKRNTLKMPLWEKAQIVLGISIPFFLLPHIIYTYGLFLFFGLKINYIDELLITYPHFIWQYIAMLLAIWIHAQIGVHNVLRMRAWYLKVKILIFIIFSSMPVIGISGYLIGVENLVNDLKIPNKVTEKITSPSKEQFELMKNLSYSVYMIFPVLYIIVLTSRGIRINLNNKNKNIKVFYSGGEEVSVFPQTTILEASRIAEIPHASICGGRGRCTTCRVKVDKGMNNLSPIAEREFKALKRIDAEKDVRLACQAELKKDDVSITLLLPPDIKSLKARKETKLTVGQDINLVVLFADLRGFTSLSEEKFPYDVVFILNKYFGYMGEVIEKNGGTIDKFLGDGILAYFGDDGDVKNACRNSIIAGRQMTEKLVEINSQLKNELKAPLEIGIGIHFGEVILGELGYKDKSTITIVGDTVNTASRLESLNKRTESQMIFSKIVGDTAGLDFSYLKKLNATVRGKKEALEIYVIKDIVNELKSV